MAAFLNRALHMPATGTDFFTDDNDSVFEGDINRLAASGITRGCNPPANDRYCPDGKVTRGQMAAFLVRAFGYTDNGGGDLFVDDDDSIFENDIDRLGTAGVTKGCNPPTNDRYCPNSFVLRDQMASFLARALDLTPISPPSRADSFPWLLTPTAIGPLALGDRPGDLEALTGLPWDIDGPDEEGCVSAGMSEYGVGIQGYEGGVTDIWIWDRAVAITAEGVRIGDSWTQVVEAFAGRIRLAPHPYTDEPVIVVDGSGAYPWSGDYSYIIAFDAAGFADMILIASRPGWTEGGCT